MGTELHVELATLTVQMWYLPRRRSFNPTRRQLAKTVTGQAISGLPLVTRNYMQIASLPSGVGVEVDNAGSGGTALSQAVSVAADCSVLGDYWVLSSL